MTDDPEEAQRDTDPYSAPATPVVLPPPEAPVEVHRQIRDAWICATASGVITLVATLIGMAKDAGAAWQLLDVAIILGLAYGIYRRSRACAVLMLVYWIGAKAYEIAETGRFSGWILAVLFAAAFAYGIKGTFAYHRLRREPLATPG